MLRQEKFGAGMADQKDLDAQFARAIMGDGKFQVKVQPFVILPTELDFSIRRTTSTILMILLKISADRKCVQMP